MWSRKVFFLLVVKIFVTVISTMDYIHIHPFLSTRNKINIHTTLTRARTLSSEVNQIYVTYLSNWAGYRRPATAALLRVVAKINLLPASLFRLGSPESSTHNSHLNLADKWTSLPFSFSVLPSSISSCRRRGWGLCVALDTDHISAMNAVRPGQAGSGWLLSSDESSQENICGIILHTINH